MESCDYPFRTRPRMKAYNRHQEFSMSVTNTKTATHSRTTSIANAPSLQQGMVKLSVPLMHRQPVPSSCPPSLLGQESLGFDLYLDMYLVTISYSQENTSTLRYPAANQRSTPAPAPTEYKSYEGDINQPPPSHDFRQPNPVTCEAFRSDNLALARKTRAASSPHEPLPNNPPAAAPLKLDEQSSVRPLPAAKTARLQNRLSCQHEDNNSTAPVLLIDPERQDTVQDAWEEESARLDAERFRS